MKKGNLYIIASPIGNLEDITLRAIKILKEEINHIFCEDTRQSKKILNFLNIKLPVKSLHQHSTDAKLNSALEYLKRGENIAYLTDSGTPGISDPGSKLVKAARDENINIIPVPGPSALTSIISISGFPEKNIIFRGFLSKKEGKRKKELELLKGNQGIMVIYESPYRIKKLLKNIYEVLPDSEIIIGREMTKLYEEFIHGKICDIYKNIEGIKEKGEFTLAIFNKENDK